MSLLINLLTFILPLGVLTRISIVPGAFLYIHDIIVGIIFLVTFYKVLFKKEKIINRGLFKYFLIFLSACLLSLVVNIPHLNGLSFFVALLYFIRLASYYSLIFALQFVDKKFLSTLHLKLIASGALFAFLGLLQYFFYPNLKNLHYAGWDDHLYRLFSTMLDPNFAGIFMVFVLILITCSTLYYFRKANLRMTALLAFLGLFTLISIYLTYSRSAFLSMIVGIVILLIVSNKNKIIYPVIILLAVLLLAFSNSSVEGLNPFRTFSALERVDSAGVALSIVGRNPILGVGFGAYRYAQLRYGYSRDISDIPNNSAASTDNSYLLILATTGVIGFIAFIVFIFELMKNLKTRISEKNVLSVAAFPILCALMFNSLFINTLFYTLILAWVFIIIGATVNMKR